MLKLLFLFVWIITNKFFSTHRQLALIPVACLFPIHINLWIQYFVMCLCVNWTNARKDALFDHFVFCFVSIRLGLSAIWIVDRFVCGKIISNRNKNVYLEMWSNKKITRNSSSNVQWKKGKATKTKNKNKHQQKEKKRWINAQFALICRYKLYQSNKFTLNRFFHGLSLSFYSFVPFCRCCVSHCALKWIP